MDDSLMGSVMDGPPVGGEVECGVVPIIPRVEVDILRFDLGLQRRLISRLVLKDYC
jgi:hypothetical protein